MMKYVDPSLVGRPTCSQRDDVIFLFSYHFLIWIYWLLYIPFLGRGELEVGVGGGGCGARGGLRCCGARVQDSDEEEDEYEDEEGHEDGAGLYDEGVGVMGLL
jgi:hypothetical protein